MPDVSGQLLVQEGAARASQNRPQHPRPGQVRKGGDGEENAQEA